MTLTANKLPGPSVVEIWLQVTDSCFLIDLVFIAEYSFPVPLGGVDGAFARARQLFRNPRFCR